MKKILLITGLVCGTAFAQDNTFNRLSIDLGVGLNKAYVREGQASTANFPSINIGGRYMLSNNFGVLLDYGFEKFKNRKDAPIEYNSTYNRFTLSGVANVHHLLNFQDFAPKIGLQVNAGAGMSFLTSEFSTHLDKTLNGKIGITALYNVTDRFTLYADMGVFVHIIGHWQLDMRGWLDETNHPGLDYMFMNWKVGGSYYIGKNAKHADWVPNKYGDDTELNALKARVAKAEKDMMDDDKDGVPNYLDEEPNTEEGKTVDTKGKTVVVEPVVDMDSDGVLDVNDFCPTIKGTAGANGCPDTDGDSVYDFVDKCPKTAGSPDNGGCPVVTQATKEVLKKAQGVQFETGKATITKKSLPILDNVVKIMNSNPSYKLEINGHTDNAGDPGKNLTLSKDRAAAVKAYLMSKGIALDRLTSNGYGDTMPVASNATAKGKSANRRVEFIIKFME
jgi:outer membrane protein OmpA-like peptidoglycan-associated protein